MQICIAYRIYLSGRQEIIEKEEEGALYQQEVRDILFVLKVHLQHLEGSLKMSMHLLRLHDVLLCCPFLLA